MLANCFLSTILHKCIIILPNYTELTRKMYVEATQIENTIVKKSVSIKSKSISKKYREAQKIITKNTLNVGKIVK